MIELLPYDEMLKELGCELLPLEGPEPAALQFYLKIGVLVIQSTQNPHQPSSLLNQAQGLLYGHLNRCHAEIWKTTTSHRSSTNMIGDVFGDESHYDQHNGNNRDSEETSSTRSDFYQSSDELQKTQQTYDDFIYTTALKEMGDTESYLPRYTLKRIVLEPPRWGATVQYKDLQSYAEANSKKAAKHSASKSLWLQMGKPLLAN
ncbi:hypothetical protein N7478_011430 [Penicillium angulare]|uniref:uncharacterized protein n=1 Tax=Penicillium angulare TaxID=116970 RepID=UPI0025415586|nr:uncharacterized protein N7478_011430 [Penicillium angulare]KAJ5263825.1 hypothetical protein N7478_011430 [Penicillium angulare]